MSALGRMHARLPEVPDPLGRVTRDTRSAHSPLVLLFGQEAQDTDNSRQATSPVPCT